MGNSPECVLSDFALRVLNTRAVCLLHTLVVCAHGPCGARTWRPRLLAADTQLPVTGGFVFPATSHICICSWCSRSSGCGRSWDCL